MMVEINGFLNWNQHKILSNKDFRSIQFEGNHFFDFSPDSLVIKFSIFYKKRH